MTSDKRRQHNNFAQYLLFPRQFASYRWFKPLLVLLLTAVFYVIFVVLLSAISDGLGGTSTSLNTLTSMDNAFSDDDMYTFIGALVNMGSIAAMLPALALAALIVRDRPYSSYSSCRGGWNWKIFFKTLLIAVIVFLVMNGIQMLVMPVDTTIGKILFTIPGFICATIVTPIQSCAEEYIFRGLIMQTVGSWIRKPAATVIISMLVQSVAFALGHMYNLLGLLAMFITGLIFGALTLYTKGLETSCSAHIINNLCAFYMSGFGLMATVTEVQVLDFVFAVVTDMIYAIVVIWMGKRRNWFASCGSTS